uniref:Uncharacterized protein n=1 Tax=Callithrix jacchus TaxID=9483 RepID=A0A8I3WBC8_CALJA
MELKNTIQELREVCTGFNTRIVQAEEGISEVKVQLNEIKREEKIREKRIKRNEQSLQEMWDYEKRPNLRLIGVPECDGENESKMENTLQEIIQENFPKLAKQADHKVKRSRPSWLTWWNPISTKNTHTNRQVWGHAPVVPGTQEAEAGESLETERQRLQ